MLTSQQAYPIADIVIHTLLTYGNKNYHVHHLEVCNRCNDEIQLFEGPTLLLCPWPGLADSVGKPCLAEFLFVVPANGSKIDGMFPSPTTYETNLWSLTFSVFRPIGNIMQVNIASKLYNLQKHPHEKLSSIKENLTLMAWHSTWNKILRIFHLERNTSSGNKNV